jgi:F-type H+-transporting ATPase subunit b
MNFYKKLLFFSAYISPSIIYAEGKNGGMPQLDPSSYASQTFWLIVSFIILFWFINTIFIPKIIKIRDERSKIINKYISDAEVINNEANIIKDKIDRDLLLTKSEIEESINIILKKHARIYEKKIKEMNVEFDKKIMNINFELEKKKREISKNIGKYSFEISNLIYSQILEEEKNINVTEFNRLESGD